MFPWPRAQLSAQQHALLVMFDFLHVSVAKSPALGKAACLVCAVLTSRMFPLSRAQLSAQQHAWLVMFDFLHVSLAKTLAVSRAACCRLVEDTAWHPVTKAELEQWRGTFKGWVFKTFLGSPLKSWASVGHWLIYHFDLSKYSDKQQDRVRPGTAPLLIQLLIQHAQKGMLMHSSMRAYTQIQDDLQWLHHYRGVWKVPPGQLSWGFASYGGQLFVSDNGFSCCYGLAFCLPFALSGVLPSAFF